MAWAWFFVLAPFVGGLLVAATLVDRDVYRFVTAEDSVLEWPQFFVILAASPVLAVLARLLWAGGDRGRGVLFGVLALGAFVVAGEEISWGQRLLDFATPAALIDINHQGEANIHNIGLIQRGFNALELLAGLYAVVVPIAWSLGWLRLRGTSRAYLFVPPLALVPLFFMPFAYRSARLVFEEAHFVVVKYGEWPELCLYVGVLAFALLTLRRYRAERT